MIDNRNNNDLATEASYSLAAELRKQDRYFKWFGSARHKVVLNGVPILEVSLLKEPPADIPHRWQGFIVRYRFESEMKELSLFECKEKIKYIIGKGLIKSERIR